MLYNIIFYFGYFFVICCISLTVIILIIIVCLLSDYILPFHYIINVFFFFFFLSVRGCFCFFFNFYCYSITVVYLFSPSLHPTPAKPTSLPTSTFPLDFVHVSFIIVPAFPSSHCPHPTPPWPLLDCSQPQCLWLYFVCFFLLLIMFQLRVRSYGICPSSPGLFHLA